MHQHLIQGTHTGWDPGTPRNSTPVTSIPLESRDSKNSVVEKSHSEDKQGTKDEHRKNDTPETQYSRKRDALRTTYFPNLGSSSFTVQIVDWLSMVKKATGS